MTARFSFEGFIEPKDLQMKLRGVNKLEGEGKTAGQN